MKNPRLIDVASGRRIPLGSGVSTIGSAPASAVVVADPMVGPQHAEIDVQPDRVVLRRLGLNPILANGREVDYETALSPGAMIVFSPTARLRFESDVAGRSLLERLLNRTPGPSATTEVAAADDDSRPAVLGILSVRQAVMLGVLYAVMILIAYVAVFAETGGEKFLATMESFEIDFDQEMSRPECAMALAQHSERLPKDDLKDMVSKALVAESRSSWIEAKKYYDAALDLLSAPKCRPARFIAVRRDAVNAAATKMMVNTR